MRYSLFTEGAPIDPREYEHISGQVTAKALDKSKGKECAVDPIDVNVKDEGNASAMEDNANELDVSRELSGGGNDVYRMDIS